MTKYYLLRKICSLLLLIFITPCFAQTDGNLFRCAIRDKVGNLWFSNMGKGVYRYDVATNKFTNFTKEDGLNDNNIEYIYEDKAGNLWFGTHYGVCRYDGKIFTDITSEKGICKFDVNCILEDRTGNIWIGSDGWGVCRYNPVSGAVTNFKKEQGLGSNAVQCILEDKAGNLWFGERAGGVCRFDTASGRFTKVNGDGCFSSQIMNIIEDKMGNIWFENLYSGLCRYDGSRANHPCNKNTCKHDLRIQQDLKEHNEELAKSYTHITRENGLCNDTICCMYEDKKGNLWFGSDTKWNTGGGGVCRYDGRQSSGGGLSAEVGRFTRFSTADGLTNSDVWCVVEDNDGNIWLGTRGGLFRYHSPSGKFINYTYKVNSHD